MPIAWDTMLVSRIRPRSPALALLESRLRSPEEVALPTASITEAVFGYARAHRHSRDLLWFSRLVRHPEVRVLHVSVIAAIAAGRLRARSPLPPRRSRGDRRSKPERRVAWVADQQIATSAWAVGVPIETENVGDFTLLSELLAELFPKAIPLEVRPSPL